MEPTIFEKPKELPKVQESSSESEEENNGPVIQISDRELNPHWKDGGDGNPESDDEDEEMYTVGDGGRRWSRKAFDVSKELAKKEGRNVNQVFSERHERWSRSRKQVKRPRAKDSAGPPKKKVKKDVPPGFDDAPPGFHSPAQSKETKSNQPEKIFDPKLLRKKAFTKANEKDDSIAAMVREEKMSSAFDFHKDFANRLAKNKRFAKMDSDGQFEMASELFDQDSSKKKKKKKKKEKSAEQIQKQQRNNLIAQHQKKAKFLDRCWFCYDSKRMRKYLTVSIGKNCYLALIPNVPLHPGQCCIVPLDHSTCMRRLEADVYEEIRFFMKCLTKMFAAKREGVIFLETVLEHKHHCYIDVVPIPQHRMGFAKHMFKKAILESDVMWNTNKRLVDTTEKGLMKSIPEHMPYFHVEFGMDGGYLHPVEDVEGFEKNFGKKILCGLLEKDGDLFLRQGFLKKEEQIANVDLFKKRWKRYDWTRKLPGGDLHPGSKAAKAKAAAANLPPPAPPGFKKSKPPVPGF